MAVYMDFSNTEGAVGFISDGEPVISVGVSVSAMPMSVKKKEGALYAQFAQENGIYFLFEDNVPAVDFYTVPLLDIVATDGAGGFIGSVGERFSLESKVPLVYISPARQCFLIADDCTHFLAVAATWKTKLTPFDGVKLYPSKEAARKDYPITDVVDTPEYQILMSATNEKRSSQK